MDRLERAAVDLRVLSRALANSVQLDSDHSPRHDPETSPQLAAVLGKLSAIARAWGQVIEAIDEMVTGLGAVVPARPSGEPAGIQLHEHLAEAHRRQDPVAGSLRTAPDQRPEGCPLRG